MLNIIRPNVFGKFVLIVYAASRSEAHFRDTLISRGLYRLYLIWFHDTQFFFGPQNRLIEALLYVGLLLFLYTVEIK